MLIDSAFSVFFFFVNPLQFAAPFKKQIDNVLLVSCRVVALRPLKMATTGSEPSSVGNPANVILNNLRLRLSALEAQIRRAQVTRRRTVNDEQPSSSPASVKGTSTETSSSGSLDLDARIADLQHFLESKPSLSAPSLECAKKVAFIVTERKTWLQTGNPAGVDLDATMDPLAPSPLSIPGQSNRTRAGVLPSAHGSSTSTSDLALLLHYARDEYIRDLSTLRTYALSRSSSESIAQWKSSWPTVLADMHSVLSAFATGQTVTSGGHGVTAVLQLLEHDVSFQANGETKTLDDLACLMSENVRRCAQLDDRWRRLADDFERTVTWANRALCEVDMSLDVAEQTTTD
jgi:hypothetical protein